MKQSRFNEEQIIQILREADQGMKIEELCRKYSIAKATYYSWKGKYGGMTVSEAKRLRALEIENSRLKRLVAEQALDIVGLKDIVSKKW
jgi:putative transposase